MTGVEGGPGAAIDADDDAGGRLDPAGDGTDGPRPRSRRRLLGYLGRKLAIAVLTVWVASAVVFVVVEVLPQDPALHALGREATQEQRAAFRERMGLNDPPHERYAGWLAGMLQLDFGRSIISGDRFDGLLLSRLLNTTILAVVSLLLALLLALPLAVAAAQRAGGRLDVATSAGAIAIVAMPEFVLGTLLILLLASQLRIVPVSSAGIAQGDLRALLLPALTLGLGVGAYVFRLARVSLIETAASAYVRTAMLNGFSRRRILWRHVMPNASIVIVNVVALNAIFLLSGVIVVENVFAYPGLGKMLVDAINDKDFVVIEAVTLVTATLLVTINLIADGIVLLLDPRLRSRA